MLGDDPFGAMLHALTLHFQPAYLNILPLYVVLLLFFALVLPLLRWPAVLAGLSLGIYGAARLEDLNLPSWTGGGWFFNPLTWQLLFMMGAILSYAPVRMPNRPLVFDILAGLLLVVGLPVIMVMVSPGVHRPSAASAEPGCCVNVDKGGLHPFRLVSILALAWLTSRAVPASARWLRGAGSPLRSCWSGSIHCRFFAAGSSWRSSVAWRWRRTTGGPCR